MSRRNSFRQPYHLDSGEVTTLSREEVALVLRAAEDLITTGGRTLLVKVLRGSKAQDIRPEHLKNPAYGVWKDLSQKEVSHRVDWSIKNAFLGLEYFGKLPLLVYPPKGLAIECQTIADEWYQKAVADGLEFLIFRISEVPLNTVMAFLDQVAENGKERGLPILETLKGKATKRISKRINAILEISKSMTARDQFLAIVLSCCHLAVFAIGSSNSIPSNRLEVDDLGNQLLEF